MRPRYESSADVENQERVIKRLCSALGDGMDYHKLNDAQRADYVIIDSRRLPVRLVEIKTRTNNRDQYREYMVSLEKWTACKAHAERLNCPFVLAVQWSDYLCTLSTIHVQDPDRIGKGGRYDRNDSADVELMAYFNITRFREVPPERKKDGV